MEDAWHMDINAKKPVVGAKACHFACSTPTVGSYLQEHEQE